MPTSRLQISFSFVHEQRLYPQLLHIIAMSEWKKGKGNAWQQATSKKPRWGNGGNGDHRGGGDGRGRNGQPSSSSGGNGKGYGKAATSGQQQHATQQSPAQSEEGKEDNNIVQQLARLNSYIDQNERFVDSDPAMAKIVDEWRCQRRSLQAQRNSAKPRDQRLRELLASLATAKKELARQQELAEVARISMEASKLAHEERGKLVERKAAKVAELEEERTRLLEESPPSANAPKGSSSGGSMLTKAQLADILAATGGAEAAQGERLDLAWAKYQESYEAKQKQERDHALVEQRKREAQQKDGAMDVDASSMEELQSSLDGMLQLDGLDIPPSLRSAMEKRKTELVEAAKGKRRCL